MKKPLTLLLLLVAGVAFGQKGDYVWLSGYGGYPHPIYVHYDTSYFATNILNFNFDPVRMRLDSLQMNFERTNTSYCDTNGYLLFYTNGCYIANSLNEKIEGSNSLNDGYYKTIWGDTNGYRPVQGIIALPTNSNTTLYPILHSYYGSHIFREELQYTSMLATLLDMSANNGNGKVLYINRPIITDTIEGDVVATRHGNGRDWWVPVKKSGTNCYYRILVTDTGIKALTGLNCGGPVIASEDYGSSAFSPDGNKYAHFTIRKGLTIFDFDRCTGELTNPVYIFSDLWIDSSWIGSGLAFSPNNRFLYASETKLLLQYDLSSPDITHSADTIA